MTRVVGLFIFRSWPWSKSWSLPWLGVYNAGFGCFVSLISQSIQLSIPSNITSVASSLYTVTVNFPHIHTSTFDEYHHHPYFNEPSRIIPVLIMLTSIITLLAASASLATASPYPIKRASNSTIPASSSSSLGNVPVVTAPFKLKTSVDPGQFSSASRFDNHFADAQIDTLRGGVTGFQVTLRSDQYVPNYFLNGTTLRLGLYDDILGLDVYLGWGVWNDQSSLSEAWSPMHIALGGETNGGVWSINTTGWQPTLQYVRARTEYDFDEVIPPSGFVACDWNFGTPQLFVGGAGRALPDACAHVTLSVVHCNDLALQC